MVYNSAESSEHRQYLMCLRSLGSEEFAPLIRHLRSELADLYVTLSKANDATLIYRMQGRIRQLEDFLDAVAQATKHS